MTQSFIFQEPVSDLGQGVLPGANMIPPWKQSAAYSLLPDDGVMLERSGQKRRRDSDLDRGLMPNERLSNDFVQRNGSGPPIGGHMNFCDFGAAQYSASRVERHEFFARMKQYASAGILNYPTGNYIADPIWLPDNARYRSHRPAARSFDSALASTAQAVANYNAVLNAQREQLQQQQLQSHQRMAVHSGFGSTYNLNSGIDNQNGYETNIAASFGGANTYGHARAGVNVSSETNWPNLACQTAVSIASQSLFESNPLGLAEPQSPCTPSGHQHNTVLSDSQQEYLRQMERINSITTPDSPAHMNSRGRQLSYTAPQEQPASDDHSFFHGFEPAPDKHIHVYLDSETPTNVDDWTSVPTHVDEPPAPETIGFNVVLEDAQQERFSQTFEPAPAVAPVVAPAAGSNNDAAGEKDTGGNNKFDLNEVPAGVGEPAATSKPRKKYHPRVAKDKRTYKRRVDGKKVPASPVEAFNNMESPAKKAVKRSSDQPQRDSTSGEVRDASHPEVVDMDIENPVNTTPQHNTAVCDCEGCIKFRLKIRLARENSTSTFVIDMPQSPVSPAEHHSYGNARVRTYQASTPPGGTPDSSSNSPSVRRNLFQGSAQAAEVLDQGSGATARRSLGSIDTTNDPVQPNARVIPQQPDAAYTAVKSFFNCQAATTSCLQQFDESASQMEFIDPDHYSRDNTQVAMSTPCNLLHQQSNSGSAIVAASPAASFEWNFPCPQNHLVPATHANNSFMSRLCPRGILSPQTVAFRNMNQIQRVVYLKSLLTSSHQLRMSPEGLLRHVFDHLPEVEKMEFKESIWPIILSPLTEEEMKQLRDYADLDQVEPSTDVAVVKRRGPKPKKPSKKALAMTLWPGLQAMKSKAGKAVRGRKSINSAASGNGIISQNGLELVPYENKAMVLYDPLKKKKPRAKVMLDEETKRAWKALMGKTRSDEKETDAEKWEEERRKMKAQALIFIQRMHVVQGDRSFSKWKGSVVDSVVGAFLTQNVNDVLSSSAFMSMRARYPGRGFRNPAPDEPVAQSFEGESSTAPSPPMQKQQQSSENQEGGKSSSKQAASSQDVPAAQSDTECIPPSVVPESQQSRNGKSYDILHMEAAPTQEGQQPGVLDPLACQNEDSKMSNSVVTEELSSGANTGVGQADVVSPENGITKDLPTEGELAKEINQPSHGKYNPKTGLTGLERAEREAEQVAARKDFDFSEMQDEFKPRVPGQERSVPPPRTEATEDGVDWKAVKEATVSQVADVIKERGLNWILAGRIKAFLGRIEKDYGSLDLEWLRSMSAEQSKDFLLSIHGLGLKSVECIRLLTLHHLAFPVDTNVGRIAVRLGWVPLEPMPEYMQLHLLESYPMQATIQKYLWPRLCKLDHETLYALHYQMISCGKVFCTKSKPNCNACPMRPDCKHFASALSSAEHALPASERPNNGQPLALPPGTANPGENSPETSHQQTPRLVSQYCLEPIVEEPESEDELELDIEDYPASEGTGHQRSPVTRNAEEPLVEEYTGNDTDINNFIQNQTNTEATATRLVQQHSESALFHNSCSTSVNVAIPETELVSEPEPGLISEPAEESTIVEDWGVFAAATSTSNEQLGINSDHESCPNSDIKIVESTDDVGDLESNVLNNPSVTESILIPNDAPSQAMVLAGPGAASIPVPPLKNVGRLRTVHYVYELPDNHPLLHGLDPREVDDPCTYLLAIWSPGEVPESIPNINDSVNEENGPFASSSSEGEETIKATLLVPCRTAMRGSFPLNGTYFQVNEVFADHASSLQPMLVPRTLLWNLRRRFVFFGTTVTSIFRGMTAAEIQACFWRGYVCVRGFERSSRAPKPLVGRLHLHAGKASGKGADGDV